MKKKEQTELLERLGKKIKARRSELAYSQEELAEACLFDRTYISMLERGKRNISFVNLAILARGLHMSISQLTDDLDGT